jgi:1-acyl-sn-glycerol-3-phosphate acyltransferase
VLKQRTLKSITRAVGVFNLAVFVLVSFVVLAISVPLQLAALPWDPLRRVSGTLTRWIWGVGHIAVQPFWRLTVTGRERLGGAACIYVANHQSFLDIYTLFWLDRPFKFISKTSNFLIPIIGWSMFLTGHVKLNRVDRRSQLKCLSDCAALLAVGAPVLFFPEGTRSKDGALGEFKKGAFSVAAKARVPVVPVSLVGTGALMPNGREGAMYPGGVTVVIHPPLAPSRDAEALMNDARAAIEGALPPAYRA